MMAEDAGDFSFLDTVAERTLSRALNEYQGKYNVIFNSSPAFIFISRLKDGKILEINKASCNALGLSKENIIGKTSLELGIWTEEVRNEFYIILQRQGNVKNFELKFNNRNGKVYDLLVNAEVIELKKKPCLLVLAADISVQKSIDRRQKLANALLNIFNTESDFEHIFRKILHEIKENLKADSVYIKLLINNGLYDIIEAFNNQTFDVKKILSMSVKENSLQLNELEDSCSDCLCGKVLKDEDEIQKKYTTEKGSFFSKEMSSLWENEFKNIKDYDCASACDVKQYQSVAIVPVKTGKETFGLLQINYTQPDKLDEDAIRFFEEIASVIGIGLNRIIGEIKIEESETQFRTIYENSAIGIFRTKPDGTILMANPSLLDMLGFDSFEEFVAQRNMYDNYYTRSDRDEILSILRETGFFKGFDTNMVRKNGDIIQVRETGKAMCDKHRRILFIDGTIEDITLQKEAEKAIRESEMRLKEQNIEYEKLNKEYLTLNDELSESIEQIKKMNADLILAKDKAEESDRLKSAFLSNMSHEVRTPMNAILGFSGFLKDSDLDRERMGQIVEIINSSVNQLLTVINDIIDLSKIEAGQVIIDSEPVNLDKLLKDLYESFHNLAEEKGVHLLYNEEPAKIDGNYETDGHGIKKVFSHLLSNAIKFTEIGTIEFGYQIKGHVLEFYVKDTGIGIAPEHHQIIFDNFRQVDVSNTRKYGGNGLGLSISKAIVEKLGGKISVKSAPGEGSTFSFTIPYTTIVDERPVIEPVETENDNYLKGKRILVVEDDLNNFYYIEAVFDDKEVELLHAVSGKAAIEICKQNTDIDLIFMDIQLPGMNGYDTTREIRKFNVDIPIIALTAFVFQDERWKALEAGCNEYLTKPVSGDTLFKAVKRFL